MNEEFGIPIIEIPPEVCENIRFVLADVDETISTAGKVLPEAYNALWDLFMAGIIVIPITGRSAGWAVGISTRFTILSWCAGDAPSQPRFVRPADTRARDGRCPDSAASFTATGAAADARVPARCE